MDGKYAHVLFAAAVVERYAAFVVRGIEEHFVPVQFAIFCEQLVEHAERGIILGILVFAYALLFGFADDLLTERKIIDGVYVSLRFGRGVAAQIVIAQLVRQADAQPALLAVDRRDDRVIAHAAHFFEGAYAVDIELAPRIYRKQVLVFEHPYVAGRLIEEVVLRGLFPFRRRSERLGLTRNALLHFAVFNGKILFDDGRRFASAAVGELCRKLYAAAARRKQTFGVAHVFEGAVNARKSAVAVYSYFKVQRPAVFERGGAVFIVFSAEQRERGFAFDGHFIHSQPVPLTLLRSAAEQRAERARFGQFVV